jgi:hypothetical protein
MSRIILTVNITALLWGNVVSQQKPRFNPGDEFAKKP